MTDYYWDGDVVPRNFYLRKKIEQSLGEIAKASEIPDSASLWFGEFAEFLARLPDSQTVALAREVLAIKQQLRTEEKTITENNLAKSKSAIEELAFVEIQIAEPRVLTVDGDAE